MARLLGEHVGPTFDRLGLRPKTKLTYGGPVDRINAALMTPILMDDNASRPFMDHVAFHSYDCNFNCTKGHMHYELIARLHKRWVHELSRGTHTSTRLWRYRAL